MPTEAPENVHVGDTGTVLEKQVVDANGDAVDLTGSTTLELVVEKKDGTGRTTLTGTLVGAGTAGTVRFTTVAGTWSSAGLWLEQVHWVTSSGEWRAEAEERRVFEAI